MPPNREAHYLLKFLLDLICSHVLNFILFDYIWFVVQLFISSSFITKYNVNKTPHIRIKVILMHFTIGLMDSIVCSQAPAEATF